MEGYELYRLSDEEIQHVGVKGMKWGKRKSREKEQGKAVAKAVKGAVRKQLAKARAKDLSEKLSKGLNIAVAVNDVYGDISPTGLKNHFANAEQLEKYGIEYNP